MSLIEAKSVNEALTLSRRHAPHLMIISLSLPPAEVNLFLQRRDLVVTLKGIPLLLVGKGEDRKRLVGAMKEQVTHFLTVPLAANDVLTSVRLALKNREVVTVKLEPSDSDSRLNGRVAASLAQFTEAGFTLRSRARLRENVMLAIPSKLLAMLGFDSCVLSARWVDPPIPPDEDQYQNRIQAFGMGRDSAEKMRKVLEILKTR
jgi:DNA-binding NtrC family response regulator